jgi:O-antigen/teichoic acid export membrane protein
VAGLFGWNFLAMSLVGAAAHIPLALLGRGRGPEDAGYFRLATTIVTAASHLEHALGRVVYPELASRWAVGERAEIAASLRHWTIRYGLPLSLLLLGTVPLLPFIIRLVFGDRYGAMGAGAQVMLLTVPASTAVFWVNTLYFSSGSIRNWTWGGAVQTAVIAVLAWPAIAYAGFLGMATLFAVANSAFVFIMAALAMRVLMRSGLEISPSRSSMAHGGRP